MKFHQGNFKRDSEKKKKIKNLFTDQQKTIIKNVIHKLDNLLRKINRETIPFQLYEYYYDDDGDDDDKEEEEAGGDA